MDVNPKQRRKGTANTRGWALALARRRSYAVAVRGCQVCGSN